MKLSNKLESKQSERDTYRGVQMEIVDYGLYANKVRASLRMLFDAQTAVRMSFEAQVCSKMVSITR